MTPRGTKLRNIRVEDELWEAAKAAAETNGTTISDIIRRALEQYVNDRPTGLQSGRD